MAAVPRSLIAQLPAREVIYRALPETDQFSISIKSIEALAEDLEKATAIILGPGISTQEETVRFVQKFVGETLSQLQKPCVIDADALNALAKSEISLLGVNNKIVLTPHPKELSRLIDVSTKEIQSNRIKGPRLKAAERFGCVVVLKGTRTIIADYEGNVFINPTGNSGMATAGAGDVLSGTIGGLLAQGLNPLDAAVCGVYLHGFAGDLAAKDIGETGLLAGDISQSLPFAIAAVKMGEGSRLESILKQKELDSQ